MPLQAPLVQAGELDAWQARAELHHALLADPPLPATETHAPPAMPAPATLLHLLLRHSVQLEYTAAAARLASKQPAQRRSLRCCANASSSISTPRPAHDVAHAASRARTPRRTMSRPRTFLKGLTKFDTPELKPLGESARRAHAPARPEPQSARTVAQRDARRRVASVDAWITSLASRRLSTLRTQKPTGLARGRLRLGAESQTRDQAGAGRDAGRRNRPVFAMATTRVSFMRRR
jgi:hypothetical protein